MLFNSYPFFVLLIITFFVFYIKPFAKYQILILIASSLVFYGYSQPYLLILLLISANINAISSYLINQTKLQKRSQIIALTGVAFNLAILAFFKYNKLLNELLLSCHVPENDFMRLFISLPLPIGISFYTFQGISLLMDTFKDKKKRDNHQDDSFIGQYKKTIFYVIFFPHLVAGPIIKAKQFFPQIKEKKFKDIDWELVFNSLVVGFFLKSVIADNLKQQTFWIAYPFFTFQSSLTLVSMLFGYSIQIFADFAGYSLIAIGVAALFGYRLPDNFNFPYISASVTEFWKRWHMSLSSWLREYLYFSLGGNRKGNIRTYINLIIVMFLGGLWHGAAWRYGVWGLWHGFGLAIERPWIKGNREQKQIRSIFVTLLKIIFVFVFVSFGWLLFKLNNLSEAVAYLTAIVNNTDIRTDYMNILTVIIYSLPIILYHAAYLLKIKQPSLWTKIYDYNYLVFSLLIFVIIVNGGIPGEFIYFQF